MSRASKAEHPRWSLTTIIAFLLAGPIVWGLHFLFVYGGHTLMCVLGWSSEPQIIRASVIVAGGAALALLVFLARAARRWRRYVVESDGDVGRVSGISNVCDVAADLAVERRRGVVEPFRCLYRPLPDAAMTSPEIVKSAGGWRRGRCA